ncbi:MAG: NAD(P)H-hydrate epimerase [Chloroflexota bacterium]|nr:NAD(P)H-hydrate epimerase [Chloroflexota bacterium]
MDDIPFVDSTIPWLTTEQMIEVDRAMIEDYHIDLIQMMENAGRCLAHLARQRFLNGDPRDRSVVILAGTGGNGGGALVAARRLHNYGSRVQVFVTRPDERFSPVPAHQLDILRRMGISIESTESLDRAERPELILDGLIGYSLKGAPRQSAATLIRWANTSGAPVLALDTPSGVDASTGSAYDPAIRATATMTLALPKEGLRAPGVGQYVGEPYLADISVPPSLYGAPALGLQVGEIFATGDIVRLR